MEDWLEDGLGVDQSQCLGEPVRGGYINYGQAYWIVSRSMAARKVFVKSNPKPGAHTMFVGEADGLEAISETGTKTPKPIAVVDNPNGGAGLVLEHLDMRPFKFNGDPCDGALGRQIALMHLHNRQMLRRGKFLSCFAQDGERRFGYPITTSCGYFPQDNTFCDNWIDFITTRLDLAVERFVARHHNRKESKTVEIHWEEARRSIPGLFAMLPGKIYPSLLHGDLWPGNAAQLKVPADSRAVIPVVFDCAPFYGHDEFDLALTALIGAKFGPRFYRAYHELIPKQPGFEGRQNLYKLFYFLNQHNHVNGGYRDESPPLLPVETCLELLDELSRP